MFRRDAPRPAAAPRASARTGRSGSRPAAAELPASAEPAFEKLRAWRTTVAKEQGMPPYVIFHDATLREIAAATPATLAGLALVNGVGETKLARYGQQILDLLAESGE
jgi:ATP-dependent DNA helicase RecQ